MACAQVKQETATTITQKNQVQQTKPTKELQTNCLGCGKPIKKLKRYYRNGKFYCSKKCWRKTIKSKEEK